MHRVKLSSEPLKDYSQYKFEFYKLFDNELSFKSSDIGSKVVNIIGSERYKNKLD